MSEMSEKARAASKEKAKRLTGERKEAVDASDYGEAPCGFMHTDQKLGNRPISKQNLATGGRAALKHGGRKSRMVGGASTAGAPFVASVPAPPQNRFSFTGQPSPFLGAAGLKKGGKAKHRDEGGVVSDHDSDDMNRGGKAKRAEGGSVKGQNPEIIGNRPTGGRTPRKDGGKADGHWMEKAFANSHGQLHKELHVPAGKKIPAKKLNEAEHARSGLERKRANLVKIAERSHHASGGKAGKGKMTVNIIVAQKPDHPAMPMGGAPMPPPRPPMPMAPPPGAMPPPGAGPQGMPAGPMPGGPNVPPPS